MGTLRQQLLDAGFAFTAASLDEAIVFLTRQHVYALTDLSVACDMFGLPGADDVPVAVVSFLQTVGDYVQANGCAPLVKTKLGVKRSSQPMVLSQVEQIMDSTNGHMCDVKDAGPREAIKKFCLNERSAAERDCWLHQARMSALLGSCPKSHSSFLSGLRCYVGFAIKFDCMKGRELPPTVEILLAWSESFRCKATFSNYCGHVRLACDLLGASTEALDKVVLRRAKASIQKRCAFVPRKKMFVRLKVVKLMLDLGRANSSLYLSAMLFLTAYVFLLRVPSEALPIVRRSIGVDNGEQSVISLEGDSVQLKLACRKTKPCGSTLLRQCWCDQDTATCPLHILWPFFAAQPEGTKVFAEISDGNARTNLKYMLEVLRVPEAQLYRTHDLRRGHADDMRVNGASLCEILRAGEWRSPAFLEYLDINQLERDAVLEAHMDESDGDSDG